jgi:hypothetical protein
LCVAELKNIIDRERLCHPTAGISGKELNGVTAAFTRGDESIVKTTFYWCMETDAGGEASFNLCTRSFDLCALNFELCIRPFRTHTGLLSLPNKFQSTKLKEPSTKYRY